MTCYGVYVIFYCLKYKQREFSHVYEHNSTTDRYFAWHNDFRHAENKFAGADDQLDYEVERKFGVDEH